MSTATDHRYSRLLKVRNSAIDRFSHGDPAARKAFFWAAQEAGISTKRSDPSVRFDIGWHVMIGSTPPDTATRADFPLKETLAAIGRHLDTGLPVEDCMSLRPPVRVRDLERLNSR